MMHFSNIFPIFFVAPIVARVRVLPFASIDRLQLTFQLQRGPGVQPFES